MSEIVPASDRVSFLRSLRAVREFRDEPVPREVIDDVLEVRLSGSASDRQPRELAHDEGRVCERISLGYPAGRARRGRGTPALKPLSEIVHGERYG